MLPTELSSLDKVVDVFWARLIRIFHLIVVDDHSSCVISVGKFARFDMRSPDVHVNTSNLCDYFISIHGHH